MRRASPPSAVMTDRIAARSTSAGPQVVSCIISRDGSVNREGFQRLIDLMGERLFKSRPYPAPEKYLDMSYLRRAQQELGMTSGR